MSIETATVTWHEQVTWLDVTVGDVVRLAGVWFTVSEVCRDRRRPGMLEVRIVHPSYLVASFVSVEPGEPATVRFPRGTS